MLLRSLTPAVLALAHLIKADDDGFSNLSSCGQNCINNMRTSTGCVPVTDSCLCSNQDFIYGITDCANQSCTSSDAQAALDWSDSWCASVTASTSTAAATSTAEATSTSQAAETTDAATTSAAAATTSSDSTIANEAAQTTSSDSATTTPAAGATSVARTSSADATATTDATSEATSDASSAGAATATQGSSDADATGASSASSSSSSSSTESASTGLTAGAKAGIVVGAAGAAIFLVGAVLYLSRKRKKPLPRGTMKISEPLPGSGRIGDDMWERYHSPPPFSPMYSSQQHPPRSAGSKYSELDRHARPYEDMVPRMTPTRMV